MLNKIRHSGIVVDNLEKSLHFYQDLLGFQIIKQMDESSEYIDNILALKDVKVRTVKLALAQGDTIELLKFQSHPREQDSRNIYDIGPTHIAVEVDDLTREYNRLKNEGIEFNAPPQTSADGSAKVTFCKAPEGTFIEMVEVLSHGKS